MMISQALQTALRGLPIDNTAINELIEVLNNGQSFLKANYGQSLAIDDGTITPTSSFHFITGEGDAADTLTTITADVDEGTLLFLRGTTSAYAIEFNSDGNISATGIPSLQEQVIVLIYNGMTWDVLQDIPLAES